MLSSRGQSGLEAKVASRPKWPRGQSQNFGLGLQQSICWLQDITQWYM